MHFQSSFHNLVNELHWHCGVIYADLSGEMQINTYCRILEFSGVYLRPLCISQSSPPYDLHQAVEIDIHLHLCTTDLYVHVLWFQY